MTIKEVSKRNYSMKYKYFYVEWSNSINNFIDDRCLAKYGPTLLSILIKSADPQLTHHIESIYTECTKLVKDDPNRNLKFLNIITSTMNGLYKKYPNFLTKFDSEMFIFLDPEQINNNKDYSHFHTFSQEIEIRKSSKSSQLLKLFKSWWKEMFYPQSSEFVNTCEKEFYTNWNGGAVVN
ncbi:hypothetical protein C1645_829825 [Glomus cerebriforme]|uniref:Uncharacterized protein n=1 Tax=Glomus cerebriforme TaxID=658196 RepID=A0A397SN72_9GLOM|nr:hypothetical protein C1645_829825 [Glomus cerebriforme]